MKQTKNVYIIGAGFAGQTIAGDIKTKYKAYKILAYLDDDLSIVGSDIDGTPVLGPIHSLTRVLSPEKNDEALICIPTASVQVIKNIHLELKKAGFQRIRILPQISQIINGDAHFVQARDIDPQDLLGRTPVSVNLKESLNYIRNQRVLITGAGGSIGSELCRQLLSGGAERLYILGHGENSLYNLSNDLKKLQDGGVGDKAVIVPVLGDIKDLDHLDFLLGRLKADIIFHCAAHKHVPLIEKNPVEGIENNVFGTKNLVETAIKHEVKRFVLISTDKAVSPKCIYGASKHIAEKIVIQADCQKTACMVVRFGNVLGSRGSIIPLFTRQIQSGGPLTITDKEVSRYFMTIPEAVSLVLRTGGIGKSGKLYILDMGAPLKIKDLAEQMLLFYGIEKDEIAIEYTGLREGEKLTEKLWDEKEDPHATEFTKIWKTQKHLFMDLENLLSELLPVCRRQSEKELTYRNRHILRKILRKYIPTVEAMDNEPEY